ncbi:MAG: oligosaccharide flippase family protein [Mucilaginibacter sp.]
MKQLIINSYNKLKETNILSNFFNLSSIQISNIVLIFLTIRLITGVVGLAEFGIITFAYKFSQFAGAIINYGTNQSAVKDVAHHITDTSKLSSAINNTLCIRAVIFMLYIIILLILPIILSVFPLFPIAYYWYILYSIPIALAEVFNPLCFFLGAEKLKLFNIYNLLFNVIAVLTLLFFIKSPANALWVNFILGVGNIITYLVLLAYFGAFFKLSYNLPLKSEMLKTAKDNFYLTVNNVSGNLQQSLVLFALATWSNASVMGAYSICDRVIAQCRGFLIIVSNAIYPNAVHLYKQSGNLWNAYRKKAKRIIAIGALVGAILIFILADFIVYILAKQHDETAVLFLRIMAFVPVVSAFNVLNVIDQLIKNNVIYIFRIAVIMFVIAAFVAFILSYIGNYILIGASTLIIEACSLLIYEYTIKKTAIQNA